VFIRLPVSYANPVPSWYRHDIVLTVLSLSGNVMIPILAICRETPGVYALCIKNNTVFMGVVYDLKWSITFAPRCHVQFIGLVWLK
jgi:hypothetical protein